MADKFGVLLADPPWNWKAWSAKGEAKSAKRHYNVESLRALRIAKPFGSPVLDIAAKDCALFLWTTFPMIFEAERLMDAWGFSYSGLAWCWIKRNDQTGKYAFGTGYGTRKNLEPCLLARRGSPKLLDRSVRDFIHAKRREHSRKPDEQYGRIEAMFAGPYLELYARQERQGWTSWGDEVGKYEAEK